MRTDNLALIQDAAQKAINLARELNNENRILRERLWGLCHSSAELIKFLNDYRGGNHETLCAHRDIWELEIERAGQFLEHKPSNCEWVMNRNAVQTVARGGQ